MVKSVKFWKPTKNAKICRILSTNLRRFNIIVFLIVKETELICITKTEIWLILYPPVLYEKVEDISSHLTGLHMIKYRVHIKSLQSSAPNLFWWQHNQSQLAFTLLRRGRGMPHQFFSDFSIHKFLTDFFQFSQNQESLTEKISQFSW